MNYFSDLEAEMAIDRDSTGPGKKWERVARMCEFNPKSTRCTKDLSRFRGLLLELKNKKWEQGMVMVVIVEDYNLKFWPSIFRLLSLRVMFIRFFAHNSFFR